MIWATEVGAVVYCPNLGGPVTFSEALWTLVCLVPIICSYCLATQSDLRAFLRQGVFGFCLHMAAGDSVQSGNHNYYNFMYQDLSSLSIYTRYWRACTWIMLLKPKGDKQISGELSDSITQSWFMPAVIIMECAVAWRPEKLEAFFLTSVKFRLSPP